ncbi:MAG: hypothetical protein ACK481_07730 [Candidatus Melainabacteria bacterium]
MGTIYTNVGVQSNAQITLEKPAEEPDILRLKLQMTKVSPIHFGMDLKMKEGAIEYSIETNNHFVSGGQPESPSVEMRTPEHSELLEREISGALTESNLADIYWELT